MTGQKTTRLAGDLKKILGMVETAQGADGDIRHHFQWASSQPFINSDKPKPGFAEDVHSQMVWALNRLFVTNPDFGFAIDKENTATEDHRAKVSVVEKEGNGLFTLTIHGTGELVVDFNYLLDRKMEKDTRNLFVDIWKTAKEQAVATMLVMMSASDKYFGDALAQSVRDKDLRIDMRQYEA